MSTKVNSKLCLHILNKIASNLNTYNFKIKGVLLSQIVQTVSKFHPEIVRSALATTAVVFTGFTIASFYATTSTLLGVYSMINTLSLYMIAAWFSSFFTYRIVSNHVIFI